MALYYARSPLLPPMARQGDVALAILPDDPYLYASQMLRGCAMLSRRDNNMPNIYGINGRFYMNKNLIPALLSSAGDGAVLRALPAPPPDGAAGRSGPCHPGGQPHPPTLRAPLEGTTPHTIGRYV